MRRVATIAVVVLLAAACRSGASLPEGFEAETVGPVTFARPLEWQQVPDDEAMGRATAQFNAPGREDGLAGVIMIFVSQNPGGGFDLAVHSAVDTYRLNFPQFELVDQVPVEVDGAERAALLEYVYQTDAGEPARSFDLIAHSTKGEEVVFSVAGLDELLDGDRARRIIDTVVFAS